MFSSPVLVVQGPGALVKPNQVPVWFETSTSGRTPSLDCSEEIKRVTVWSSLLVNQVCFCSRPRHFSFDPQRMRDPVSEPFRDAVKGVCGMTSNEINSLLSSLPSELCFNDLRDAGRRHKRAEKTDPKNLHCVASKSSEQTVHGMQDFGTQCRGLDRTARQKGFENKHPQCLEGNRCVVGSGQHWTYSQPFQHVADEATYPVSTNGIAAPCFLEELCCKVKVSRF